MTQTSERECPMPELPPNKWHRIEWIKDGKGKIKMWLDGKRVPPRRAADQQDTGP